MNRTPDGSLAAVITPDAESALTFRARLERVERTT
jgi:hypothetical protein